jgi:hypothetical protein
MLFYRTFKKSQFPHYFILILIITVNYGCSNRHIISNSSTSATREFKNAGEQENYWAEQLFNKDYKVEHYKKYKRQIVLDNNHYQYKDVVITIGMTPELRRIFDKGIFYPGVMVKAFKYQPRIKITINKDSLIAWCKRDTSKIRLVIPKTDSVWIDNFKEMKFLETNPKQRRFSFWLARKWLSNPTVYFMELTNKNATAETDLLSFIDGAKLTFFQEGWVII